MKKLLALTLTLTMSFTLAACDNNNSSSNSNNTSTSTGNSNSTQQETKSDNQTQPDTATKKVLVAYFSREGNTQQIFNGIQVSGASLPAGDTGKIANEIHENVGGDILEIVTTEPYSPVYREVTDRAKKEQDNNYRPKLATNVKNIDSYDVIFLGYPNWWGTLPMPVFAFLEEHNFSGKTIIPFSTHEGSALGRSVTDIKKLYPQSTVLDGLAIRSGSVHNAQKDVSKWLSELGIVK
jgi:flavodoxin